MPKEFTRKRGGKRSGKKDKEPDQDQGAQGLTGIDSSQNAVPSSSSSSTFYIDTTGSLIPALVKPIKFEPTESNPRSRPPAVIPSGNSANSAQVETGFVDPSAPFGLVDPDIKAYLRSVDDRLREWEGLGLGAGEDAGEELEDRTTFLHSSLSEIRTLERTLATDSDTSLILERLLHSMGDWGRRVVADSFIGGWGTLLEHRFGSHVCQTLLGLAGGMIDREARGIFPKQHLEQETALALEANMARLRTMTELVKIMAEEILPVIPSLLISTFASPPIRLLLILLSPGRPIPSTSSNASDDDRRIRSKKSQKYRAREAGAMKSVLGGEDESEGVDGKVAGATTRVVPENLISLRKQICASLTSRLSGNEWRSMGVSSVGGPAVQILLELEAEDGLCERSGSILDHLTSGLVMDDAKEPAAQDYVPSLLRDVHGSHLLQAMLKYCPLAQFDKIWKVYFIGRIGKLAAHPMGNFVVSTGIERLNEAGLRVVVIEIRSVGASSLIRTSRTAALKALVERAASQLSAEVEVVDLICESLELEGDRSILIQCALTLNIAKGYHNAVKVAKGEEIPEEAADEHTAEEHHGWKPRRPKAVRGSLEPSIQGALLLQSMMLMHEPAVNVVLDSLLAMKTDELLALAHHPISSHVLDAVLTSPTVPAKYRRKLILGFVGQYLALADDCFGSRVADTIWARSDGYLKEKVARSMLPNAIQLGNSRYGRFFARKLNLQLLERRPDEWREMQLGVVHHFNGPRLATTHMKATASATAAAQGSPLTIVEPEVKAEQEGKKRKRVKQAEDEAERIDVETAAIDDVFAGVIGDKPKKKKKKVKAALLE